MASSTIHALLCLWKYGRTGTDISPRKFHVLYTYILSVFSVTPWLQAMSKLYQPYRSLGLITGDVSPAFQALGKEQFIYAPIGRAYHVYKADTLRLAFVSPLLPAEDEIQYVCPNSARPGAVA